MGTLQQRMALCQQKSNGAVINRVQKAKARTLWDVFGGKGCKAYAQAVVV